MIQPITNLCLVAALVLSACQPSAIEEKPTNSNSSQAYKAHRVADANFGFADLCLASEVSVKKALETAERLRFGYRGSYYGPKRTGTPDITLSVPRGTRWGDQSDPLSNFSCAVRFRGTWAEDSLPVVQKALSANGFLTSKPLSPTATETRVPAARGKTILYEGTFKRAGRMYTVSVGHSPSGRDSRNLYLSTTVLILESVQSGLKS